MANTKNSISSLLEQFLTLESNALAMLSAISTATTTTAENVTVNTTNTATGVVTPMLIPSFGAMTANIARLDANIQQLAGLGDANAVIRLPDGTTKQIIASSILTDPPPPSAIAVPSTFSIKNNWFFESFLNPLLVINFDVTGQIPANMTQAVVKRIIVNTTTTDQANYFDNTWKGKNDIVYAEFLVQLDANSIQYFVDEEIVEMPVSIMRFTGSFNVLNVVDKPTTITSNATTITTTKRNYVLNTLNYSDILAGTSNTQTLQINDVLITSNGSKYQITSVDNSQNTVILTRISGSQPIQMGQNSLNIYSSPYTSSVIQVNVGFNERQVVFVRSIEPNFNVASSQYSPGVGFYSNEMTINTPTGSVTLDVFYQTQVTDFGQTLIGAAKEKHIPSVLGETPNIPSLDPNNFEVIQTNAFITDTSKANDIKQQVATKVKTESQIKQLNAAISTAQAQLNSSATMSSAQRLNVKSTLSSLATQKASTTSLYSSVVTGLNTIVKDNPAILLDAKFSVIGFWPMPLPAPSDATNLQEVVQFRIGYRYIRTDGTTPETTQMKFTDTDGTTKIAYFSNWYEYKSDLRQKVFNTTTGFYEWAVEDVTNADSVNINQLNIPISSNEQVQIRIASISEAGWPLNAVESGWSDIITIPFPTALQTTTQIAALLTDSAVAEVRVDFQNDLNALGLDLHLASSFTSGDKYYAHVANDITSGQFDASGNIINLFDKLSALDASIAALTQIVTQVKGFLQVYIIDSTGNVTNVTPNSTTNLFAGFYKNLVQTGSGTSITYNYGNIITTSYILRIENGSATALELASYLPGGLNIMADVSALNKDVDYAKNRQYDLVPIVLSGVTSPISGGGVNNLPNGSISQQSPFQSAQSQGLWLYMREKNVGLNNDLYGLTSGLVNTTVGQGVPNTGYPLGLRIDPITEVYSPSIGCFLLPTDPTNPVGTTNPNVWNGGYTTTPTGGGVLSEFCIHTSHPNITGALIVPSDYASTFIPPIGSNLKMVYPNFIHSDFFQADITDTVKGSKQLEYISPKQYTSGITTLQNYPAKSGFYNNDTYLIGKYTCGAYLYLAPANYSDISVDGSTATATHTLNFGETAAVNIQIVFQFRCADILGYIGGYRTGGTISNVTYTKTIGVDIQIQNLALFSFDISVSCKFQPDSIVQPVYVPNVALSGLNAIRNTTQTKQAL